jgi:Zn-dependent protease with chaperone function/Flp pilus assembly protein TadD
MKVVAALCLFLAASDGQPGSGESPTTLMRQQILLPPAVAWTLVAGAWIFLVVCNIAVGWPQKQEAKSSLWRLLGVCASLAAIGALPAIAVAAFASRGSIPVDQCLVAAVSTILSLFCLPSFLRPPVRLRGTKEKLPLVTDDRLLARVTALSTKMGVPVPLVRLWPSISGSQQALAFVGTLQAPQLVVTDGILQRLETAESDAIIAHELGHVANGSIWLLATVIPVSCAVMTAATAVLPVSLALPFGIAFLVGLRRLVNRPAEFDCDYRAAQAIGFRATASALAKIHAVNPIPNSGLLSLLVFATATHPPRVARLAALYAAAQHDERPEAASDDGAVRKYRRAAGGALAVWAVVLCGTWLAAFRGRLDAWLAIPLWIVAIGPLGLLLVSLRKRVSRARRRMGRRWSIKSQLAISAAIGVAVFFALCAVHDRGTNSSENGAPGLAFLVPIVSALALCGLCVWLISTRHRRALTHKIAIALQVHDFRRALELCLASPKIVCRAHVLRYQQAIAEAVCGRRAEAIAALERLWRDKPRFPLTALGLGELLLDADRPQRTIEVAASVARQLPHDPAVPVLEARALRRLGQVDEAQAACDRALAIDPDDGCVNALAAAIALDRGENQRAQALIARALELAPGEVYLLVVRAEIALQNEPVEQARIAVERAVGAVRANPLVFLQAEISRLETALLDRLKPVITEDIFIE